MRGQPIEALAFGVGPTRLLVHGGIHGDEPASAGIAERFSRVLGDRLHETPRVVIVPAANPDGLAAGTKDNARGVDLNRNFPAENFSPTAHKPGYFPGPHPLSEPESAALAALVDRERPGSIVALHQPFRCVNFDGPARALAEELARASGWPVVEDIGYPTPGSFGSCYGRDRGLAVITLELPASPTAPDLACALAALHAALAAA